MPLLAVNHHYYRDKGPGQGIYPTSPRVMAENIARLQSQGWSFGGEPAIHEYLAGATDGRRCVITLDDGLKEQMACLVKLESLGVPALFFVSTAPVIEGRVLDVHKLHMIRAIMQDEMLRERLEQRFGMDTYVFDDAVLAVQYRYDKPVSARVKYFLNFVLGPSERDAFTGDLFEELYGNEREAAKTLYMSRDDWRILAAKGYLGTHGHRHVPLAMLDAQMMHDDIRASREILREATGHNVSGISYPFGGKTAVSEAVFEASLAQGLTYGFTMQRGVNQIPAPVGAAMQLQRIDVNDLSQFIV